MGSEERALSVALGLIGAVFLLGAPFVADSASWNEKSYYLQQSQMGIDFGPQTDREIYPQIEQWQDGYERQEWLKKRGRWND